MSSVSKTRQFLLWTERACHDDITHSLGDWGCLHVRMKPTSGYVNELLYRGCLSIGWDGRTLYLLPVGGRLLGMRVVGIPAERLRPGRRRSVAEDLSNWQLTWGLQWFRISGTDLKVALGKDWAKQVESALRAL